MNIIDLTPDYIRHVIHGQDFATYESVYPQLFEHYYQYWSQRRESYIVDESVITASRGLIVSALPQIESDFAAHKIDTAKLKLILFVGQGNTNGHAFRHDGEFAIWIPVETYDNRTDAEVFITHEIAHALHYEASPSFYFEDAIEKQGIARQLITEGVATYYSKIVGGCSGEKALWGEYLVGPALEVWMQNCIQELSQIKRLVKENFTATEHQLGLFYADDPGDILHYRSGYYLGLVLVEGIAEKYDLSLNDLLSLPRTAFERYVLEFL